MMADDVPQATASNTPQAATPSPAAVPVTPVPPSATTSAAPPAATSAALPPVTYTVVRGDTLSGIAAWFALHGYGDLYAANSAVIGADPNLIVPGETITINGAGMVLTPAG